MKQTLSILTAVFAVLAFLVSCGGSEGTGNGGPSGFGNSENSETINSGGIYGIVRDYATGDPVGNANIRLRPGGETWLTHSDGGFEFSDLNAGDYYISVSRAEYEDLVDQQVSVSNSMVRYDLRIKKNMKEVVNLDITDNDGNPLPNNTLDFGSTLISRQFKIYNAGAKPIKCDVAYSAKWVNSVNLLQEDDFSVPIQPGKTYAVVVNIDRNELDAGENRAPLLVTTNNGNKELTLVATKEAEMPEVKTLPVTDSSGRTDSPYRNIFHGEVTALGNPAYTERGFCYSSENQTPGDYDMCVTVSGTGLGEYEYTNFYLGNDVTRYYVRAYVRWNGTYIYGNVESFVWNDVI